ncbi:MAG: hypothetical protein R3B72_26835 [Polyangiaceae bacterium]
MEANPREASRAEASRAEASRAEAMRGVPLVQLAAIHAATAEGFPLEEVLTLEGLPSLGWFEAEASWKRRLVERPEIFADYEDELARHQARLGRRVEPIDEEVEEWVTFLRIYGDHPAPFDLLDALGMGLPDLSRLSRLWTERFEDDPRLAKRAAKAADKLEARAKKGAPIELAPIVVRTRKLVASEAAGAFAKAEAAAEEQRRAEATVPTLGLDRYAALRAELAAADKAAAAIRVGIASAAVRHRVAARARVLERFGLTQEEADTLGSAWDVRLASDEDLQADFEALTAHYAAGIARRGAGAPPPPPPSIEVTPPPPPLPTAMPQRPVTAPMRMIDVVTALPFQGSVAGVEPIALHLPPISTRNPLEVTGDLLPALLDQEIIPFDDPLSATGELSLELLGTSALPFAVATIDATGEVTTTFLGLQALPFEDLDDEVPTRRPSALDDEAPHVALGRTAPLKRAELGLDALPFDEAPSLDEAETESQSSAQAPTRAQPASTLDATTFLGPLDLDLPDDDETLTKEEATRAREGEAWQVVDLTLDQYASLQAELSIAPERAQTIRARYHLADADAHQRVIVEWEAELARDPDKRALYVSRYTQFRAWLSRRRVP